MDALTPARGVGRGVRAAALWVAHRTSRRRWLLWAWVMAVSLSVGYLVAGRINDVRQQQQAAIGFCTQAKAAATADVPSTSSELGRNLVRISAGAYEIGHCQRLTGPLGDVDPDAFRPAPPTSPSTGGG